MNGNCWKGNGNRKGKLETENGKLSEWRFE
jgi:hypothetical protein